MDLIDDAVKWFEKLYYKKQEEYLYGWLDPVRTPFKGDLANFVPEKSYIRVSVEVVRLINVRKGLTKFFPALHSSFSVPNKSGNNIDVNSVISPEGFKEFDSHNLDKVLIKSTPILGPVPYQNNIACRIAMLSVKSANLAKEFLSLLVSASDKAGVSFISSIAPYSAMIKEGIGLITQADGQPSILELGLIQSFSNISPGVFLISAAPKNSASIKKVELDADYTVKSNQAKVGEDYPYIVLTFTSSSQREDWFNIPDISQAYNIVRDRIRTRKVNEVKEALEAFRIIVLTSFDLIPSDADNLVKIVESEVNAILPTAPTAVGGKELPELKEVKLYGYGRVMQ